MNIGFFTATYYPTPDGVSHYLRDLKAALEKKGHSVHVFSLNGDRKEANVHVPYSVPFPAYPQYSVPIFPIPFHIFSLAKKAGLDIIHIHDPFMGSLGYRVSRQMGIPAVATFHTDFVRMKDSLNIPMKGLLFDMTWRYTIFLYRRCSTVLAPSRKTVRFLIDSGLTRVTELPLFVDDDVYRCEKRIVGDAFRVQFIGRITRDKGVFNILRIASLLKNNKDIKFVISGTGPDEERLVKNIRDQGLTETVEFTGYVSPEGKIDLLKRASVFLYPAVADTFGISVWGFLL
ncbi:glycosyltransferase [Thermoplasmatales archaeon AK]|nr:glycosyltransferase [Thermoplasmatales archaeon AK]